MNKKDEIVKIAKYIFSSGTSFIVDLLLFTVINNLLNSVLQNESIIVATIIARIFSSLYNYCLNAHFVFKKYNKTSIIKYYILVVIQMFTSAVTVYFISKLLTGILDTFIKLVVDIIIFVVNYEIQRRHIFK